MHGGKGLGAFRRDAAGEQPLRVLEPAVSPLRVAASRSHRDARTEAFMQRMGEVEAIASGPR